MKNIRLDSFMIPFKELLPEEKDPLFLIVVYENTLDLPGVYCARLFVMQKPTAYIVIRDSLEQLLETIPNYMTRLEPHVQDDPNIKAIFV